MATPTRWLNDFQVNTGTAAGGTQRHQQSVGLSNGNILVTWQEDDDAIGALQGVDVIGKIYDAEGNVVRESFQLNSLEQVVYFPNSSAGLNQVDVAATADGGFVLTYRSATGTTGAGGSEIYWERFAATGNVADTALVATIDDDDNIYDPRIAFDQLTGASIVTFTYREGGLSESYLIQAVSVTGAGNVGSKRSLAFLDEEGDPGHNGSVAVLANGNFVAFYSEADSNRPRPQASIFNATTVTATLGVSNDMSVHDVKVASLANGNWVAVWDQDGRGGSGSDIKFRIYGPDGTTLVALRTAAGTTAGEVDPDIVALPDGDFVITWDNQSLGIEAQRFNPNGTLDGSAFSVFAGRGATPDVAVTGDGRLVFSWDSEIANTITASIWDPRPDEIAGFAYQADARNFVETTVLTARRDGGILFGGFVPMTILGQEGNDTVIGLSDAETILGRGGNDSLQGGPGADRIEGGDGDDTIEGGQGSDFLIGGAGRDTVSYRNSSAAVSVTINGDINANNGGDAVADELFAFEVLLGSRFDDTLRGATGTSSAAYAISGGGGADTIVGGGSTQTGGGNDSLFGEAGDDAISGGIGADVIDGGLDNDTLNGNAGNDTVRGGPGDDTISGGANGFGLFSGGGNDQLFGDAGTDSLFGDVGNDTLNGGVGGDVLNGGSGTDWADYSTAAEKVTAVLAAPSGNLGDARGDSYVSIENLRGTNFEDRLSGDNLANRIEGLAGTDLMAGREGNDVLAGGAGNDKLTGGAGADDFLLASRDALDADIITDFVPDTDRIALDGTVFGLPVGALSTDAFVLGPRARDSDDRLVYHAAAGKLYFDADGNGAQESVLLATLTGKPSLDAGDFIVVAGATFQRDPVDQPIFDDFVAPLRVLPVLHGYENYA